MSDTFIQAGFAVRPLLLNDVLLKILPVTVPGEDGDDNTSSFGDDETYIEITVRCEITRVHFGAIENGVAPIDIEAHPSLDVGVRYEGKDYGPVSVGVAIDGIKIGCSVKHDHDKVKLFFRADDLTYTTGVPDLPLPRLTKNVFEELWKWAMLGEGLVRPLLNEQLAKNPFVYQVGEAYSEKVHQPAAKKLHFGNTSLEVGEFSFGDKAVECLVAIVP